MPFVITTRAGGIANDPGPPLSRRAVATLEEASDHVISVFESQFSGIVNVSGIDEDGGRIGPLPDGTVLGVERTTWPDLALAADLTFPATIGNLAKAGDEKPQREIIDAFNAKEGS